MPQHDKNSPQNVPTPKEAIQGLSIDLSLVDDPMGALELARDYRGDTTVHLKDGTTVKGFVFDVGTNGNAPAELRMDLSEEARRESIPLDRIHRIDLDGRDMAAGKTWENWVRRYAEKKFAGEVASIESTPLD